MDGAAGLIGLFISALVAATVLPAQSEAVLVALLAAGAHSPALLVTVATLGNILGALINYALGWFVTRLQGRRWFPLSPEALARAQGWYARGGYWSLLLSWVPLIGDPLTVAAGALREPLWRFVLLVGLAKTGRYVVLALVALKLL